jgi:hypothetical protein
VLSLRVFLLICFVVYGGGVVVGSIIVWFDVASVETVASGNGQRTNWNDEERESKREKKANKNDKSFLPSFTFLR